MPTTTTGIATEFITFSRPGATGGGATVTDSDGRIKWAPHNLLLASEQFDASAWNKASASVSVTANAAASPDGASTADKIIPSTGNVEHVIINNSAVTTVSGAQYIGAIYAKAAEYGFVFVSLDVTGSSTACAVCVNLSDGTTSNTGGSGTYSVTSVGNGWWRISISATASTTSGYLAAYPRAAAGTTTAYVGTGTSGLLLWGASLYRSDLGGMQANTSAYPMYNPTTPKNLLGYTESFDNAYWTKNNFLAFGSGSTANAIVNPVNGLQTADLLTPNTTNGAHQLSLGSSLSFPGGVATHSYYVKPNGYTKIGIAENAATGYYAAFNLTGSGSVIDSTPTHVTPSIAALADGWYRIACTIRNATTQSSSLNFLPDSYTSGTVLSLSWVPNGTSGIYIWGAQLSDSASLDPYVPVYGAAVTSAAYYGPRRDFDGSTLACKGLLVEEQRTNLVLYSDQFDNTSYWTTNGIVTAGMANAAVAPTGTSVADALTEDTSTGVHRIYSTTTLTAATYTLSFYAKANGRQFVYFYVNGGNEAGVIDFVTNTYTPSAGTPTVSSVPVGNSWYRVSVTFTNTITSPQNLQLWLATNGTTVSYTGNGTSGIYLFGVQIELGSFATSYIPTGAAVGGATRTADVASVSTQAFPYSSTAESVVVSYSVLSNSSVSGVYSLNDSSGNNRVDLRPDGSVIVTTGGAPQVSQTLSPGVAGTVNKIGVAVTTNDFAGVANGGAASTDATVTMPASATILNLGYLDNHPSAYRLNGWIRQITYIPRRLSNAELQTRTTP